MALTDGFIAVIIAIGLGYYFLYKHPIRWVRMVGCFAIMIVAVGLGVVEDTIPMFILMSINLLVAGLKFVFDVGELLSTFNK